MPDVVTFANFLHSHLTAQQLAVPAYAKHIGVGVATVRAVLAGRRKPPADIVGWLSGLKLSTSERQRLRDLAAIAWLPDAARSRFLTLVEDSAHLHDIRGTMVLADQLFQDRLTGKWVIAGTYSHIIHPGDELSLHNLQLYLRLQVERPGRYPARIWCVDRQRAPNDGKIWDIGLDLDITAEGVPVFEARVLLPGGKVKAPIARAERKPGEAYALQTSLWLRVGHTEVASCPLDFIFPGPPPDPGARKHDDDTSTDR